MRHPVILLPGVVLPAGLAYEALLTELGERVDARPKDLELYAGDSPPDGYGFDVELAGIARTAEAAGFGGFHLVGYSGGGAVAAAFTARHPDRVLSLALLEPAWLGTSGRSEGEVAIWAELDRIRDLPHDELMPRFMRIQLADGVPLPDPPPGPAPAWMAQRPAGIRAMTGLFRAADLDRDALSHYDRPVYYGLGGLSNPRYFGAMAERLGDVFSDYTLDVFPDRHHFDPPHRVEPERLGARLLAQWDRAPTPH